MRVLDRGTPTERCVATGDLAQALQLEKLLEGHDAIVHLAGRAHVLEVDTADEVARFHRDNVEATERLARAAVATGVRRFVLISTVGVHGNRSMHPLSENDALAPIGPYAESKLRAERVLWKIAERSSLQVVVLRPTLTYGPDCPGNMARLARLIARALPLPLASFDARRSLMGIDNLVTLIEAALLHPAAAGETFLAADGQDVCLTDIIRHLAAGLGVPARLYRFPPAALSLAARLAGLGAAFDKLTSSLTVDISKVQRLLGWSARVPLEVGLRETGRSFARDAHRRGP